MCSYGMCIMLCMLHMLRVIYLHMQHLRWTEKSSASSLLKTISTQAKYNSNTKQLSERKKKTWHRKPAAIFHKQMFFTLLYIYSDEMDFVQPSFEFGLTFDVSSQLITFWWLHLVPTKVDDTKRTNFSSFWLDNIWSDMDL